MFTRPGADTKAIDTISPVEIAEVIDHLAARIRADGNADLLGPWLIARAAAALGLTVIQASSPNPVEVVEDLGADWASLILAANRERPEDAHRILRAAHGAFAAITRGWAPTS